MSVLGLLQEPVQVQVMVLFAEALGPVPALGLQQEPGEVLLSSSLLLSQASLGPLIFILIVFGFTPCPCKTWDIRPVPLGLPLEAEQY